MPPGPAPALRDELVRAAVRQHRRRAARPRIAAAVGAIALATVGGLLAVARPSPALADVRVERTGGRVVVTLVDLEHDAHRIEARLRAAGLDVSVTAVPAGPSQVGRFVGDEPSGEVPGEVRTVGAGRTTFAGFSLPVGWRGSLDLHVGRPARGDEPYAAFADALAPGEPLGCRPLVGRTAGEVAELLAATQLDVAFAAADGAATGLLSPAALAGSGRAGWVVVGADATSRHRVVIRIREGANPVRSPAC
jgi:hypothetical protein